jgi:hypothetical protein
LNAGLALDTLGAAPRHTRTLRWEARTVGVVQQAVGLDDVAFAFDGVSGEIGVSGDRSLDGQRYTVDTVGAGLAVGPVSARRPDGTVGSVLAVDTVGSRGSIDTRGSVDTVAAGRPGRPWRSGGTDPTTTAAGGGLIRDARWAAPTLGAGLMGVRLDRFVSAGQIRHVGFPSGGRGLATCPG